MLSMRAVATPLARQLAAVAPGDRLGVSVFGSLLLHMLIVLGVGFSLPKLRELQGLPTLEITLVQTQSDQRPDDAELLAQANQDGGGNSDRADIARNPLPVREISDRRQLPQAHMAPQPRVDSPREVADITFQNRADWQARARESQPEKKELRTEPWNLALAPSPEVSRERARLNAEISRNWQELQQRPRRKYLNARTQEYKYAAYMDAWRAKVERIGNLNYPEEARRRHLTGSLQLDVELKKDGGVHAVTILRSSGSKLLDDAAVRIVELSSPFAPFSPEMRAETDILHITRTWKFNETLTSER